MWSKSLYIFVQDAAKLSKMLQVAAAEWSISSLSMAYAIRSIFT